MRQLALVLDALRMAAEVQHSREAIVTAREEERRRLRRELHDGLGSALAGIALTLQAAHNAGGPRGDELVEGAREQTEAAVADVRRIVRGLRPPMLEDLGLAAALRAHADRLAPLEVELVLPPALPPLPAAVELALYRIATEALTNAVRHAHARRVPRRAARGRRRGRARDRRRRPGPGAGRHRGHRPALDARASRGARRPRRARHRRARSGCGCASASRLARA